MKLGKNALEALQAEIDGRLMPGDELIVAGPVAAEGTADKIAEITKKLEAGELQVFDTTTFTVDGKEVDSYKADVDTDADYVKDTEVIENGAFQESKFRSAPYFDLQIDGIKLLDTKF